MHNWTYTITLVLCTAMCVSSCIYTSKHLKKIARVSDSRNLKLPPDIYQRVKQLGILKPVHRGKCKRDYQPHNIPVIIRDRISSSMQRTIAEVKSTPSCLRHIECFDTIPVITTSRDSRKIPTQRGRPTVTANTAVHKVTLTPRWAKVKCAVWNSRSLNNKTTSLCDFVIDENIDILSLTETWLSGDFHDQFVLGELSTVMKGYTFYHQPRKSRGGGVGVLVRSNLHVKKNTTTTFKSFEYMDLTIRSGPRLINLITIYRPPPSAKNKNTATSFINEFSTLLETLAVSSGHLLVNGDFNYHLDSPTSPEVVRFVDLLDSANLVQHVIEPTHHKGHILDLVISRQSENIISPVSVNHDLPSDHYAVLYEVELAGPGLIKQQTTSRNYKNIDMEKFKNDIILSNINVQTTSDPATLVENYDDIIRTVIDKHAPVQTKSITLRPRTPWFNNDLLLAKKSKRRLERKWLSSKLVVDYQIYRNHCKNYNHLLNTAKADYHRSLISESDDKKLFRIVNEMSGNNKSQTCLPDHSSKADLANNFAEFFVSKVAKLKAVLITQHAEQPSRVMEEVCATTFPNFTTVSELDVLKSIKASPTKGCPLDPLPTWLLKDCLPLLAPAITRIVNSCFASGCFPAGLKKALVTPLIKKPSLDADVLSNYRPVSNLSFLSKLLERIAVQQLQEYLCAYSLLPKSQSAYRKHHSTETALLRVQNDILRAVDRHEEAILVLLDLSAAFDTLDHVVLLKRLNQRFGIQDKALSWFKSYLEDRFQSVVIGSNTSTESKLNWGVPQGSVMGPVLFSMYTAQLEDVVKANGVDCMIYADDTQLYVTMKPDNRQDAKALLENCIRDVKTWMKTNHLKLNDDKTEVVHFSSRYLPRPPTVNILVGDSEISPSGSARNIGVMFDKHMTMSEHIQKVARAASSAIWKIGKICHLLDQGSRERLVHAFVSSRLDYCNSLLYGVPDTELMKLQRIQNTAARLVTKSKKNDSISSILNDLHWLPVRKRIEFKIQLLTYKSLNNAGPEYLSDLLEEYEPPRTLRSTGRGDLDIPKKISTKTYGQRAYSVSAPTLWNKLSPQMRQLESIDTFKNQLKTSLYPK